MDAEKPDEKEGEQAAPGNRRRPGPVPGPPTRQYVVLLDEEDAEWGKRREGGLSALLRRLLRQERAEAGVGRGGRTPPP